MPLINSTKSHHSKSNPSSPPPLDKKTHHHSDRKDLAGEHPFGDLGQLILVFLFFSVWFVDSIWLHWSTWLNSFIPIYIRLLVGSVFLGFGLYLARKTMQMVFGEERNPPQVIDEGVYAFCRHPMYLAAILIYVAFIMYSWSLIAAGVLVLALFFYGYIARYEEKLLKAFFGESYISYIEKVPRWGRFFRK